MIVHVQTRHLSLSDERFVFVMDQLEKPLQILREGGRGPLQVDVILEKTVRRAPQMRRDSRLYQAEGEVDLGGETLRATGRADDVQRAITRMAHRLGDVICAGREVEANQPRTEAQRAPGLRRSATARRARLRQE